MIRATLAAVLVSLACYGTALADECDAAADRVMQATGSTFVRRSDSTRFFRHTLLGEHLTVYCGSTSDLSHIDVSTYWTGAHPPAGFYDVSAKAGAALTGDAPAKLLPTLNRCHATALRNITADEPNGEVDGINVGQSEVMCGAYVHGDGGTHFTFFKRR